MAEPTIVQRKMLAKMGIAMPDGSYYIRNKDELSNAIEAVGRATPDAGESDVTRRNDVRQHCITRAKALHLMNMIPDTWNSDGSLKQSTSVEDILAHFGVKGMHWGVHLQRALELHTRVANGSTNPLDIARATLHTTATRLIKAHGSLRKASAIKAEKLQGIKERDKAGKSTLKDLAFLAGAKTPEDLARALAHHPRADKQPAYHSDIDEFLAHFGVKGMHWGVRQSTASSSTDRAQASRIAAKVSSAKGTHVLSNEELSTLNRRLELEASYKRLTGTTKGRSELEKILVNAGKQEAGKYAAKYGAKGAEWLAKEATKALLGTKTGAGRHS